MADNLLRIKILADTKQLGKSLDAASTKLKDLGNRLNASGKSFTTNFTAPLGIAAGIALSAAANFGKLKTQLNVLTGSADEGAAAFERLVKFSAATPFQLDELVKANNTLMGFGVSTEDAFNHLQMIGDISAVSGGSLQGISVAFGQVAAAGRLMGQDLLQLINNGVPIIDMLSESMGVSKSEIKKMVSEGAVTFPVLIKAFKDATGEGGKFNGGMEVLSQTISGVYSTLKDNLNIAFAELGNAIFKAFDLKNVAKDFIVFIQNLTEKFKQLEPETQKTILIIAGLVAAIGPALLAFGALVKSLGFVFGIMGSGVNIILKLASAFKILTVAIIANPITALATGIVLLTAAFIEYLHQLNPIVSRTKTFFNILKSLGNPIQFTALQLKDSAIALEEERKETEKAAIAKQKLIDSLKETVPIINNTIKASDNLSNSLKDLEIKWDLKNEAKEFKNEWEETIGKELSKNDTFKYAFNGEKLEFDVDLVPVMDEFDFAEIDLDEFLDSKQHKDFLDKLENIKEVAKAVGFAVADAFEGMAFRLVDSLELADTGFDGFVKGLLGTITKLIGMMLAAAISQAIAGGSASGLATGALAVVTTPAFIATAVGGVLSAFAAIPKFADGGIVSGPTLGLMGEYSGARSNPEVIAPLDKLKGMIGQGGQNINVGGEFRIQGQDLVVALQRAERNRSRIL